MGDREGERLVGQKMSGKGALGRGPAAEPGSQRRRIKHVAGVEEEGEQANGGPREAARHVADRGELRGAAERDQAHRHRLDRREMPGGPRGQAVDEPEPGGADDDPETVEDQPAACCTNLLAPELRLSSRRQRRCEAQRRNVFSQVPSQTTKSARFSAA